MKKFRSIISVILAAVMIMSTLTLCFVASAEGADTADADAVIWEFDISVGDVGSEAILSDGPFSLARKEGTLSGTVTEYNGVASIVTTEATPTRAFSKSPSGIIDITPAKSTISQIIFTAPEAGVYYYDVSVVITSTTVRAGLWTEIGKNNGSFNGTDPTWGYSSAAITNDTFDGWLYNTDRLDAAKTVTLAAGETIILSVEADDGPNGKTNTDETQLTVNKFDVVKVNGPAAKDVFQYDASNPKKVNGNYTLAGLVSADEGAALDSLDSSAVASWWNAEYLAWHASEGRGYWARTDGKYPHFQHSQFGYMLDAIPEIQAPSVILYTAPKAGLYHINGEFVKATACESTISVAPGGDFVYSLVASKVSSTSGETMVISEYVELEKGEQLWIKLATTNKNDLGSFEISIKSLSMTCLRYATNVSATPYLTLENGSTMWLMLNEVGKLPDGEVYTIDGTPMFWSDKYNAYCYLKIANDEAAALSSEFAVVNDTAQSVVYNMDVNDTGEVEINDAQLVYDMYNAHHADFTVVTVEQFLRADLNGDRTVDSSDAILVYNSLAGDPWEPVVTMWTGHGYDRVDPSTAVPNDASTNYTVYMAKNEDEGVNIALRSDTVRESLRFVSLSGGNSDIEWEAYYARPVTIGTLGTYTDALIPLEAYGDISLEAGVTTGIYLNFKSSSDTPAGDYPYEFALVDAQGNVLSMVNITVHVWKFELYSDDLHESLNISTFETAVYIDPTKGIITDPVERYEFLLDYGLCAYDLPYDILDERANAYMSDPRVTSFRVPYDFEDGSNNNEKIKAYLIKLKEHPEWLKKAFFYPVDEPTKVDGYNNSSGVYVPGLNDLKTACENLKTIFEDVGVTVRITCPYFSDIWYSYDNKIDQIAFMDDYIDLHCPKLANWNDDYIYDNEQYAKKVGSLTYGYYDNPKDTYGSFADRMTAVQANGEKLWSYVCNDPNDSGYLNLTIDDASLGHRVLFWQFYQRDIEGFLYWSVNAWMLTDPWEDLGLLDAEDYYGDGILVYPGNDYDLYGQFLPSVRLVGVRDGLEDIEYMYMAEALLGSSWLDSKVLYVAGSELNAINATSSTFATRRIEIGNAIEQALNNQ